MDAGYYSIDNTDTNCQIPVRDYQTTYNVIDRFKTVLENPKNVGQKGNVNWENISNVVVDANSNTYYLLKSDFNNASYLKVIVVGADGKLLVQQDIDKAFTSIDNTQKNKLFLMNNARDVVAVLVNDNGQLYRYYYIIKSTKNATMLEMSSIDDKSITRDSKENYYSIDTNTIPFEPRTSVHGSNINALIKPLNDQSIPSSYPCLMSIEVNNGVVNEKCSTIKNKDVYQYIPSLRSRNESKEDDARYDFGTDYDVFSGYVNNTVYTPPSMVFLGSGMKMQRFDWSSPNYYYANDDGIGLYRRSKDPLKSSVLWQIPAKELSKSYDSINTDFVAYSDKDKHLFTCVKENEQGEDGHIAIIDTNTKKVYEDKLVPCSKDSVVLLKDNSFISSTKDGINYYKYDKKFNIQKVKTIGAAAAGASFISSPVVFNDRVYANGDVYCNDNLSKELVAKDIFAETNKIVQDDTAIGNKDGFNYKPILIALGVLALLAVLGFLLFVSRKKKNNNTALRNTPSSSKEDFELSDEDFDIDLNVGVRNSRYSRVTLQSKHSFSSKHTANSHISQKSLIKKTEHSNQAYDDDDDVRNVNTSGSEIDHQKTRESIGYVLPMSPVKEELSPLKTKPSEQFSSESSYYQDAINDYSDTNGNGFQSAQDYNTSNYTSYKDSTFVTDNTRNMMSPSTTNDSTFVVSDKMSPSTKYNEEGMDDILYKNSKAPLFPNKNQNKSSDNKAGLVKTKNIPKPNAQQVVIVNNMLADENPFEEAIIENGSEVSHETDNEIDTKSEKSKKSLSYLAPFITKIKSRNSKSYENNSEKNINKKSHTHHMNDSSSTIYSSNTVKPLNRPGKSDNITSWDQNTNQNNNEKENVSGNSKIVPAIADRSSLRSTSTTSTIKKDGEQVETPRGESSSKNEKPVMIYDIPEFPETNIKNVYKKPLLGKQSKASLMSVDPLKIDSDTFKEHPQFDDLFFDEDGIPPPPEFNRKILTSDNSSDLSFRTSKTTNTTNTANTSDTTNTKNTTNTSNSNYSERLNDIKQQYRQFQNNLQNQNKYSNESSDQTSFFSASAASSIVSNQLDDMKIEELNLEKDPFFVPPPPKKNNVFLFPGRNGSKSSVRTGKTSYYSASSAMFDESPKKFNNVPTDPNFSNNGRDDMSDAAHTSFSYNDPNNDNASINSFHSCIAPVRTPSRTRNIFANRDSDQFSSTGSSNFYSIKSAQLTSQSLPSNGNGVVSPTMTSPTFGSSPLMHRESIKSSTTFQSAADDGYNSGAASVASEVTNPFLRNSYASTVTSSSENPVNRISYDGPLPSTQNVFTDTSSFASAVDSFHTVNTNGRKTDYNGPLPSTQNVFTDTSSFASAVDSFHTVNTNVKKPEYDGPSPSSQNVFNDTSSFASAADSFHTVKTSGKKPEYDGPLPSSQNVFNDASSFASAADSFHTVKTSGKKPEYDGPVPRVQNFTDASSFVSAADSFFTVKSSNTQATDATSNTFKTAKPGYNPFKN